MDSLNRSMSLHSFVISDAVRNMLAVIHAMAVDHDLEGFQ